MDYQWAEGQLREYVQAVCACSTLQAHTKDRRKALLNLNLRLPHVNDILASLTPDHSGVTATTVVQHQAAILVVERALGTVLVATVQARRQSSRLLQPGFPQANGQSSFIQTRPDLRQNRMACKRSGVRIPIAPPILSSRISKTFFEHIPGLLAEAFWGTQTARTEALFWHSCRSAAWAGSRFRRLPAV